MLLQTEVVQKVVKVLKYLKDQLSLESFGDNYNCLKH